MAQDISAFQAQRIDFISPKEQARAPSGEPYMSICAWFIQIKWLVSVCF